MSLNLVILAIFIAVASGLPGLFLSSKSLWGQRIATLMMAGSSIVGLTGAFFAFGAGQSELVFFPWPAIGNATVGLDSLSAFFLVPVFLVGGLGSIYGTGYWHSRDHRSNCKKLQLFWGFLVAGMALLVISRHAMSFLFGWEVMALAAFFLITTEDQEEESCRSGWIYFISAHISTLTLCALFGLWRWTTGSYDLVPAASGTISFAVMNVLFLLSLLGFGIKAGIMPFHFWLPGAHANAPSHISAIMSGVVLKMGVYGLVRFLLLLPDPPYFWGLVLLLLGAVSGLLGVLFAIAQHDLKRLLAYHSVENIGIIVMGLGLAMIGRSTHQPEWIVLGMAGCLLHTWNHSLFKSLLFLSAGSVVHSVHTRNIDSLGGLAKTMPFTSAMFLTGAVAICGLPPLNGFISEIFIYIGLFKTVIVSNSFVSLIVITALAMVGALALLCFIKVYGAVFLGSPRTVSVKSHESPLSMLVPMVILALLCLTIGLMPMLLSPILDSAISDYAVSAQATSANGVSDYGMRSLPIQSIETLVPLNAIGSMSILLVALILLVAVFMKLRCQYTRKVGTWDCGYSSPTSRIQYTASSFAQMIVEIFHMVLSPHINHPLVDGLFPETTKMHSHVDDIVLDRVAKPLGLRIQIWFGWCRRFQKGVTQHYILYILIVLIVLLSTIIPFNRYILEVFAP